MLLWPFRARETDATETRASLATSLIVTATTCPPTLGCRLNSNAFFTECKRFHKRLQKRRNMAK
jgi:hypothetical protein